MKKSNILIVVFAVVFAAPDLKAEHPEIDFDGEHTNKLQSTSLDIKTNLLVEVTPVLAANKGYIAGNDPTVSMGPKIPVEWITLPGGKFLMGTNDFQDTRPIHEVAVNTFEMSKTPVTVAQYAECVGKGKCAEPIMYHYGNNVCTWRYTGNYDINFPINCISWDQAKQYAAFVGARFPSESEWEYAATDGGKNQKYPWGNSDPEKILQRYESYVEIHDKPWPVSYKSPYTVPSLVECQKTVAETEHGLCDMTGNVYQFIEDIYKDSYIGAPADGSAFMAPVGTNSVRRVVRGGSFKAQLYSSDSFRSDKRGYFDGIPSAEVGFRLARTIKPTASIEWVTIPGGKFKMGTSGFVAGFEDTKPVHDVTIKTFEMSKTDVTVAQYMECFSKGKCTAPDTGDGCNWNKPGRQEHPVNCVDWNQANQYAEFVGARLPSESEWEYAARSGGKNYTYPWGDSLPTNDLLVMNTKGTMPVCFKPAGNTEQGVCDMGGNVFQWVQDIYQKSYEGSPVDGGALEAGGPLRVLRGSPFNTNNEATMRSAYRFSTAPGYRYDFIGFRVARLH